MHSLSLRDLQIVDTFGVGSRLLRPRALALDNTGMYLYVTDSCNVHVISTKGANKGKIVFTLETPEGVSGIPSGVAASKDFVVVSYPSVHRLVMYPVKPYEHAISGFILHTTTRLSNPRGLSIDCQGNIIVCDNSGIVIVTVKGSWAVSSNLVIPGCSMLAVHAVMDENTLIIADELYGDLKIYCNCPH